MNKTLNIRIKYKTWLKLRREFPAKRNETTANYLEGVVNAFFLKENRIEM